MGPRSWTPEVGCVSSQGPQKRKSEQCQGRRLADQSGDLSDVIAGQSLTSRNVSFPRDQRDGHRFSSRASRRGTAPPTPQF